MYTNIKKRFKLLPKNTKLFSQIDVVFSACCDKKNLNQKMELRHTKISQLKNSS